MLPLVCRCVVLVYSGSWSGEVRDWSSKPEEHVQGPWRGKRPIADAPKLLTLQKYPSIVVSSYKGKLVDINYHSFIIYLSKIYNLSKRPKLK